jgi:hypothetical protein
VIPASPTLRARHLRALSTSPSVSFRRAQLVSDRFLLGFRGKIPDSYSASASSEGR